MSLNASAAHLLDDFLESIEGLPAELRAQLEELANKDGQFEEARKALFKKRNLYLRAEEKGLDTNIRTALLKKTEREQAKLVTIIDEKLELETRLYSLIEQHLTRLEMEMSSKLGMNEDDNVYSTVFTNIPDVTSPHTTSPKVPIITSNGSGTLTTNTNAPTTISSTLPLPLPSPSLLSPSLPSPLPITAPTVTSNAPPSTLASRPSPKRRSTLQGESIDPNEPVYCFCRQASYGDMIACDNPNVHRLMTRAFFMIILVGCSVNWNGFIILVWD